jgi:hypothetical protein
MAADDACVGRCTSLESFISHIRLAMSIQSIGPGMKLPLTVQIKYEQCNTHLPSLGHPRSGTNSAAKWLAVAEWLKSTN